MRIISALAILVLLITSSCGHNKIRKVRVSNKKTLVIKEASKDSRVIHVDELSEAIAEEEVQSIEEASNESFSEREFNAEDEVFDASTTELETASQDTIYTDGFTKKEKVSIALRAQRDASQSLTLFGVSIALIFLLFPLAVFTIIWAWSKYSMSRKANYNTPIGIRREQSALVTGLIVTFVFIAIIALVLFSLFIF